MQKRQIYLFLLSFCSVCSQTKPPSVCVKLHGKLHFKAPLKYIFNTKNMTLFKVKRLLVVTTLLRNGTTSHALLLSTDFHPLFVMSLAASLHNLPEGKYEVNFKYLVSWTQQVVRKRTFCQNISNNNLVRWYSSYMKAFCFVSIHEPHSHWQCCVTQWTLYCG